MVPICPLANEVSCNFLDSLGRGCFLDWCDQFHNILKYSKLALYRFDTDDFPSRLQPPVSTGILIELKRRSDKLQCVV